MALATTTVNGRITKPDGSAWASAYVNFKLKTAGTDSATIPYDVLPRYTVAALTDPSGDFSATLWVNGDSEIQSIYRIELPSREVFDVIIPTGAAGGSIELSDLIANYQEEGATQQSSSLYQGKADIDGANITDAATFRDNIGASSLSDFAEIYDLSRVDPGAIAKIPSVSISGAVDALVGDVPLPVRAGDLSMLFRVRCDDWDAGAAIHLFSASMTDGGTSETLLLSVTDSGSAFTATFGSTDYDIAHDFTQYDSDWIYIGVSIDRSGNMTLVVNSTTAGTVDVSAQVSTYLTSDEPYRLFPDSDFSGDVAEVCVYNVALTEAEMVSAWGSGISTLRPVTSTDRRYSYHQFDFSDDHDIGDFNPVRTTIAAEQTVGTHDDVLKITETNKTSSTSKVTTNRFVQSGVTYRVRLEYYIPSDNNDVTRIRLSAGAQTGTATGGTDAWTAYEWEFTAATTGSLEIELLPASGAVWATTDSMDLDYIAVDNVIIEPVGLLAHWEFQAYGTFFGWRDSTANGFDLTANAANLRPDHRTRENTRYSIYEWMTSYQIGRTLKFKEDVDPPTAFTTAMTTIVEDAIEFVGIALGSSRVRGELFFPHGIFPVNAISITDSDLSIKIVGASPTGARIKGMTTSTAALTFDGPSGPDKTIESICFLEEGLYLAGDGWTINNVWFRGCTIGLDVGNVSGIWMNDCVFEFCTLGLDLSTTYLRISNFTNILLHKCVEGAYIGPSTGTLNARGVSFSNIQINAHGAMTKGMLFRNITDVRLTGLDIVVHASDSINSSFMGLDLDDTQRCLFTDITARGSATNLGTAVNIRSLVSRTTISNFDLSNWNDTVDITSATNNIVGPGFSSDSTNGVTTLTGNTDGGVIEY